VPETGLLDCLAAKARNPDENAWVDKINEISAHLH
jgi:hypothetical protein